MNFILMNQNNKREVILPKNLRWVDEYDWSSVAQSSPTRSLSGAIIIQQGVKIAGRNITLEGDIKASWMRLKMLRILRDWTDIPELVMTLKHFDGREFQVIFRLDNGAFSQVTPVRWTTPELENDYYKVSIRLMSV